MNDIELDYDELDRELQEQIGTQLKELERIELDRKEIGNGKKLIDSISQIVWEQFIIQIGGQAGQDFIKENHNLKLSLKKADHYLDPDKFVNGEMPSHNFGNTEKYQKRYDSYQKNFQRDSDGNIETHSTRMGTKEETVLKEARYIFDKDRPTGSKENHTAMDHTISAAEIMRDKEAGTFLDESDKVKFANSEHNLNEIDSSWNQSKSDLSTSDWLDNPNAKGQKPKEIFDISDADEEKLREKDAKARKEWDKRKNEGEQRAIDEGNASRRAEALRSAGVTTQAIAVALLAKLTRTVFQELVIWLGEKDRKVRTFFSHLKNAISDFVKDFKKNVLLSVDVGATVILTQIYGVIIPMIRKAFLFLKIGGKTIGQVRQYLRNPNNKGKETSTLVMDIGKIVTIGLTTSGGIALGAGITAALTVAAPPLAVSIPVLGSPAGLFGIFFGGLTAGICGAIVLKKIDGALANRMLSENTAKRMVVQDGILALQDNQFDLYTTIVDDAASKSAYTVKQVIKEIEKAKKTLNEERESQNESKFKNISSMLDDME
ncbi:MAG: hypothetical protein K6F81_06185 [Acholeplasmatales bacterium]|nr:hypothetical protein [Acholeplasmatales bacterium]